MARRPTLALGIAAATALLASSCALFEEESATTMLPDLTELEAPETAPRITRPDVSESFTATECPFEVELFLVIECGRLTVPESRGASDDRSVEVAVAILRTPNPDPAPDPVVYLAGGPGGVALADHGQWIPPGTSWEDHPILAERDMILVDQRGTGYSTPSLWCAEVTEELDECHDRLVADDVRLEAYSTPEIAADIADLRVALGIDRWNLYGSSYGTRLALVILRDRPEGVRSVIAEGVYPPDVVPAYHEHLGNTLSALGELADACAAQSACARAYGDVNALLVEALERADNDPSSSYDSSELLGLVVSSMYAVDGLVDVPLALRMAADGDVDGAADLLLGGDAGRRSPGRTPDRPGGADPTEDSAGLFHSIECREEHAFTDLDVVLEQAEGLVEWGFDPVLVDAVVASVTAPLTQVCPAWRSGVALPTEQHAVTSDVPTLLLSGRFDPITPSAWADQAAALLSRATHVVAPTLSHSLVLEDPCIDAITAEFLDDPTEPPGTGCVRSMRMPTFTLPA